MGFKKKTRSMIGGFAGTMMGLSMLGPMANESAKVPGDAGKIAGLAPMGFALKMNKKGGWL